MAKTIKKRKLVSAAASVNALNGIGSSRPRSSITRPGRNVYDIPSDSESPEPEPPKKIRTRSQARKKPEVTDNVAPVPTLSESYNKDTHVNDTPDRESETTKNNEHPNDEQSGRRGTRSPSDHSREYPPPDEEQGDDQLMQDLQEAAGTQPDASVRDQPQKLDKLRESMQELSGQAIPDNGNLEAEDHGDNDSMEDGAVEGVNDPDGPQHGDLPANVIEKGHIATVGLEQQEPEQQNPNDQEHDFHNDASSRGDDNEGVEDEREDDGGEGSDGQDDEDGGRGESGRQDDEVNEPLTSPRKVSQGPSTSTSVQVVIQAAPAVANQSAEDAHKNGTSDSQNESHTTQPAIRSRRRGDRRPKRRKAGAQKPESKSHLIIGKFGPWFYQILKHAQWRQYWVDIYERTDGILKAGVADDSMPDQFEHAQALIFRLRDLYLGLSDPSVTKQLPPSFTAEATEICNSSFDSLLRILNFPEVLNDELDPESAGRVVLNVEAYLLPPIVLSIVLALRTYILFGKAAKKAFLRILQLLIDCCERIDDLRAYYQTDKNHQRSWKIGMTAKNIKQQLVGDHLLDLIDVKEKDFDNFDDLEDLKKKDAKDGSNSSKPKWSEEEERALKDAWIELETTQSNNRLMHIKTRIDAFSRVPMGDLIRKANELNLR